MNVGVIGFGHFAGVVASCLSNVGHGVRQADISPHLVRNDQWTAEGEPEYSPHRINKTSWQALDDSEIIWIAYDVPLDATGGPAVEEIESRILALHRHFPRTIPFLISCQWPVGTLAKCEIFCVGRPLVYVVENVRVGKAVHDFLQHRAVIVGARLAERGNGPVGALIEGLFFPFVTCIEWMSPESAEMAKHALNTFVALQIAFINEIADLSHVTGADAEDVSRALLTDPRISPQACLTPGAPFGGGSLKRDVVTLMRVSEHYGIFTPIIDLILESNNTKRPQSATQSRLFLKHS